jgi:hypothetical protein
MAEMGEMEMPLPNNTLPMMTGFGPFGAMEMGGMFTVVKVREGLERGNYADPGWYKHPEGTVAYELASAAPPAESRKPPSTNTPNGKSAPAMKVIKPKGGHQGHH